VNRNGAGSGLASLAEARRASSRSVDWLPMVRWSNCARSTMSWLGLCALVVGHWCAGLLVELTAAFVVCAFVVGEANVAVHPECGSRAETAQRVILA